MEYKIPDKNVNYIARARQLFSEKSDIAYLYGAKGQRCTDAVFEQLWSAEPSYFKKYNAQQKAEIKHFCVGKRVMDCSGFINECVGQFNYSTGYWSKATDKTSPAEGLDGNILYTTFGGRGRHIGLDIGHGFFIHCPSEGKTLEVGVIADYPWEGSGRV